MDIGKGSGYVPTNEKWAQCDNDVICIMSSHVECVALLSKLKSDQHIEVELKTDKLDLTSAESKATYNEIKAYVKEHSCLTVSSLNIAHVKQGIIERENYNKVKTADSRQPKCTEEKEEAEAIVGALKYYRMV